ncbi:recombinase family protein [Amycolatopsis sp. Hca4]|uniref:recombinase family protein n=1 Tax=Amycolatopsis sp. Hca4 TaxID=2742131 RepID=UPI0020CAA429|nr:recombinase family protein [Amycolatopsis sp. Hca4]
MLAQWVSRKNQIGAASTDVQVNGLRFAFYGRTSTTRHQDRVSSQGWQRGMADELVAGHGQVVAAYFDAGTSRRLPWRQRPQAARLMAAASSPESAIDAIVVGEYERAFTGSQFATLYTWCTRHGIQLWLPETSGPVDLANRDHRTLLALLATQSQREVLRARHRVLAAMHNQASQQGRYLGGRPPYGYQLVDAGPHPNPADARWGRRLQRLAPDPRAAPHVAWMFRQRLAGHSVASIARHLNERGVPCPSSADPDRNRHRTRGAWTLRTVAVILANPRYTGRQIWNRRATETSGPASMPAVSAKAVHPALVTEQDFISAQQIRAARPTSGSQTHRFALAGLIHCGVCDRRLDSHWNHGRPTYRCRHGHTSTNARASRGRRRSTSARTISSTRSASASKMKATTATPRRRLTDQDADVWRRRCATQERSLSTTAPDGGSRRSIQAKL